MTEKNKSSQNLLRTSLHSWHTANGGKMVDFGGWEMPLQYEHGILKEHLGTRRYGGLFDVSHMGEITVCGSDSFSFLQKITTNDLGKIENGQAHYSAMCYENGMMFDDGTLFKLSDTGFRWICGDEYAGEWLKEVSKKNP